VPDRSVRREGATETALFVTSLRSFSFIRYPSDLSSSPKRDNVDVKS
jgi:hypothetical protein